MIEAILEQHASEAAFLWRLRDAAVTDPHYDLADLGALDERVEANLDGLRLAGDAGWDICVRALGEGEVGEAFAATVVGAGSEQHEDRIGAVLDKVLSAAEGEGIARAQRAVVSALGWIDFDATLRVLHPLLAESSPPARRLIAIGAFVAHRTDPGPHLDYALYADDLRLRSRALMAVGELGRADLAAEVRRHLGSDDGESRFAAAWTLALGGDRDGVDALAAIAEVGGARSEAAAILALRRLEPRSAGAWVRRTAELTGGARVALIGAGAAGDSAIVPFLVEQMEKPELARVAAEAFSMITGADLARDGLVGSAPEGFEAGPTDNPDDERVAPDPDQHLPWPNVAKVTSFWQARRASIPAGTRHLVGKPIEKDSLQHVLRRGYQRQRHAAALELALASRRGPFEVRARAPRQLKDLHRANQ